MSGMTHANPPLC